MRRIPWTFDRAAHAGGPTRRVQRIVTTHLYFKCAQVILICFVSFIITFLMQNV